MHLHDCQEHPIERVTERGIRTSAGEVELHALILATGYHGLSGALMAFAIEGRAGHDVRTKWAGGARSYLGLMMAGLPDLFMVCGSNGPAALANIITLDEQNVNWICDLIAHMRDQGIATVEPRPEAEDEWMETVFAFA